MLLTFTVTEVAQVVGTLQVLSLAITPAAAARRITANPLRVTTLAILFAVTASVGGLALSLTFPTIKASVLISITSFAMYLIARLATQRRDRAART